MRELVRQEQQRAKVKAAIQREERALEQQRAKEEAEAVIERVKDEAEAAMQRAKEEASLQREEEDQKI